MILIERSAAGALAVLSRKWSVFERLILCAKSGSTHYAFVMHVPFPDLYRNRFRLPRLSGIRRKIFRDEYLSDEDIARMDARPEGEIAQWRGYQTIADTSHFDRWLLSTKNDVKIKQ